MGTMGIPHVQYGPGLWWKGRKEGGGGGREWGLFCHLNESHWKLHEMDRSSLKKIPYSWGGGFCHLNESCWKLHEMDRSSLKKFPCWGGGFSASQIQSYKKLPEMDRYSLKKFFSVLVGGFSAKFSGIFIFIIDSYYRDLSCSKSITKSFVM